MGPYEKLEELLNSNPWAEQSGPMTLADARDLTARLRMLADESDLGKRQNHVKRQHTVSQCLQKGFTEDPSKPGSKLEAINLELLDSKTYEPGKYPTKTTGYILDFVDHDSRGSEALWKLVEDCIPQAIPCLEYGLPGEREQKIIRATVGLHWARRLATKNISKSVFQEAMEGSTNAVKRALALTGRLSATPQEVAEIQDDTQALMGKLDENGVLFRWTVERTFRRAVNAALLFGRIFVMRSPVGAEFIIGDNPVVVHDLPGGNHRPDTPLLDLFSMTMPLTPEYAVQIARDGQGTGVVSRFLTKDETDAWNYFQVVQAEKYVMHRPGNECLEFVQKVSSRAR